MKAWAHLPNAALIDWVIEDSKRRPDAWGAAGGVAWGAARDAARQQAWFAAREAAEDAARNAARNAAWYATRTTTWDVLAALTAYDHSPSYLDLPPQALALLVEAKDPAAILLQPYIHLLKDYKCQMQSR